MTQEGIVTKLLPGGMAEVAVTRMTACGGNCGSCESCMLQSEIKTSARNLAAATPGQRVLIESRSSDVFGAIFLVYVMPLVFFLLGYGAAYLAGLKEGLCILCSFLGLAVGALLLVLTQRRKKKKAIGYDIIKCL
ncbi:MAG: SoxR reducing system RseC family protein [Oscillospiraceae bacterium]|nr:SoxR reducing system RseC family protein [Oscillospiraceae bacterium]